MTRLFAALLLLSALTTPAFAAPCQMLRIGSLDMTTLSNGLVTVPVTLAGEQGRWLVDTGNVVSVISDPLVQRLHLKRMRSSHRVFMAGDIPIYQAAVVPTMEFAGLHASDIHLNIAPERTLDDDTIGMLAPDIMRSYDVEFDFAAATFSLFMPHDCPNAVYWSHGAFARLPITIDSDGHILVRVKLDGTPIMAEVDTGSDTSFMSTSTASSALGIDTNNPAIQNDGVMSLNGLSQATRYRYPFHTLSLEGVEVSSPNIEILNYSGGADYRKHLVLGIETLRQLHVYIAYKEGVIYVTPAEQR